MIAVLAGGVGAARFLTGLTKLVREENLTVIANTGDDIELFGLHISPDIDIVAYTLAGIVDDEKGWGIKGDTFHCLSMLGKHGQDTWFNLGDQDLATHIYRTSRLTQGIKLSQITSEICWSLGLKIKILPMTNDKFETHIKTSKGTIHFEEYFVKRQFRDVVLGVEFNGSETAKPAPGVLDALFEAEVVVVCPSNPIVSIGTILAVEGVRDALQQTKARVVGVSPIVGGFPIKGPADKLMRGLGFEVSAFGVAKLYSDFLDAFVIDSVDAGEKSRIEKLGIDVTVARTVMKSLEDKVALAKTTLNA
ncbi:MAG TPA: 2-phospho-L-lactate transferase [Candidatus Deferrimicrobiaceae bacterium]|nr:2-phospho-L-lactate transferase [Candidatus Deferrimicrobiaceae bacterium]